MPDKFNKEDEGTKRKRDPVVLTELKFAIEGAKGPCNKEMVPLPLFGV